MNYPGIIKDIFRYRYQINQFKEYNTFFNNLFLYRFFVKWRFFRTKSDSIKYKMPWITFSAIQYLDRYLTREMKVFEYGCGGSTLFFAMRAKEVISIEHDPVWFDKLSESLKKQDIKNVIIKNIEPAQANDTEKIYTSENENYTGLSFKRYAQEILQYPDDYFDVILIDGRARNGCFLHSIRKVKKGGLLVWDNTERPRYRVQFPFGSNTFKKIEVPGPTPFSKCFTLTTIFVKK